MWTKTPEVEGKRDEEGKEGVGKEVEGLAVGRGWRFYWVGTGTRTAL
jgi:hypothetical protein